MYSDNSESNLRGNFFSPLHSRSSRANPNHRLPQFAVLRKDTWRSRYPRGPIARTDRFPSERRRRVSAACLHLCIHVYVNETTHLPRSRIRPGKRRSVVPFSLSPLSFPLISDKAISIYRVSWRVSYGLSPLSPPPFLARRVAKFLPLWSRSNPRALASPSPPSFDGCQAHTFSRGGRRKRKRRSEDAIECVTLAHNASVIDSTDLFLQPANF